jgi:sarcosine oxidase subunit gamma
MHDAFHHDAEFPRAVMGNFQGLAFPLHLDDPAQELQTAQVLALADVSFLPRMVVKGPRAASFLESHGVPIPAKILAVLPMDSGGLIARTGGGEFFLEDGICGDAVARLEGALDSGQSGVYRVLRQDAALVISGARAGELFRHVCGYDFQGQTHGDLVFTQVAGVSCSVLRTSESNIPAFRLWTDGTFGLYIWHTLLEVVRELGGDAVGAAVFYDGLDQLRSEA